MSSTPLFNVGGLASGLDTNTIVSQLMAVERNPQILLKQHQTVEEARQSALRDVETRVQNLQTAVASLGDATAWGDVQTVDVSDTNRLTAVRTGGAAAGAYSVAITQLARADQWRQAVGPTSAAANDTIHITAGSGGSATTTDVAVLAGDSLQTIADKINGTSGTPVYAAVVNSQLVLSNRSTGTAAAISAVTTDGGSGLSFSETQTAKDAIFSVDGTSFTRGSNIVTDALVGVTLTLKGDTSTSGAVTLTVGTPSPDTDAIQKKIQDFVDQYNSTVDFIRGKLTEKRVANPTTDADRVQGVLNGDSQLDGLLTSLRSAVGDLFSGRPGDVQALSQVGLSTGATTGSGTLSQDAIAGKLTLDTSKLSDLLKTRMADVKALFTNATGAYATEGLSQRLHGIVDPWVTGTGNAAAIFDSRIASEQSVIDDLKQQQSDMDVALAAKETALRAKFTAMETALSQLQAQGSWLTGQIAKL